MVDKITSPVPPLGLVDTINQIIDAKLEASGLKTVNNQSLVGSGNINISATVSGLTASRALASDANGDLSVSSVTSTELGYLSGVTSAIQTQLNDRVTLDTAQTISGAKDFTGNVTVPTPSSAKDNSTNIPTTAWVRNHCCTTKATTTSTASKDAPAYVVKNYASGTSWYRVWSDGWIEQGGTIASSGMTTEIPVTFLKSFSNTNYTICLAKEYESTSNYAEAYKSVTKEGFGIIPWQTTSSYHVKWYACGY